MDARHREFEIDGQQYVLRIGNDNQIGFCEVSLSPDSGWYFGVVEYLYNYDDTGNCQNPYRVFRTIAEAVLLWIRKDKPKWFRFWTISHSKADIFRKLVQRYGEKILDDYYMVEWPADEGVEFAFYKLVGAKHGQ